MNVVASKSGASDVVGRPSPIHFSRGLTSQELTVEPKGQLVAALSPYVTDSSQVLGFSDMELLLLAHPDVERRHPKLWLTGSTHLVDMVHADVRNRSAGLIADIEQAVPTYVRHSRFAEARERLHDGRVLIIVGDPGVGKTTLARMLVADALANGYDEPIAVSRHTDEIRRVLDTERRQVILYDDFLGRTALDRLDKNQDRELTGMMRQVLRAPHTLFILTTREYILRNAEQLHEELRHGGVEKRRYLLHLGHYTLLDRARIFLNHAYQSTSLPRQAARTLLNDEAYLGILEHPNYNPRTIAYITGMEGPALEIAEPDGYLQFALSRLDDPARLWRQSFRHEIGPAERSLLLAVASAPTEVTEGDLRNLYDALASRLGTQPGQEAFEDALHSLDDSMLRTYQDVGRIFVTARDPSVDDYLASHVAGQPDHARAVLESAQAFEQVEWVLRHTNVDSIPDITSPLADAVRRTYSAEPIRWREVFYGDNPEPVATRDDRNLARRLMTIHGFMQRTPPLEPLLRPWWQEQLGGFLESLGPEQHHQRRELLSLVKTVRGSIAAIDGAPQALAEFMSDALYFDQQWSTLVELHDIWPDLFSPERWEQLRRKCQDWVSRSLTAVDDFRDVEEVDEVVAIAARMEVPVDEELLHEARYQVWELHGSRDEYPGYEPPESDEDQTEPSEAERTQVHEVFARFIEDKENGI